MTSVSLRRAWKAARCMTSSESHQASSAALALVLSQRGEAGVPAVDQPGEAVTDVPRSGWRPSPRGSPRARRSRVAAGSPLAAGTKVSQIASRLARPPSLRVIVTPIIQIIRPIHHSERGPSTSSRMPWSVVGQLPGLELVALARLALLALARGSTSSMRGAAAPWRRRSRARRGRRRRSPRRPTTTGTSSSRARPSSALRTRTQRAQTGGRARAARRCRGPRRRRGSPAAPAHLAPGSRAARRCSAYGLGLGARQHEHVSGLQPVDRRVHHRVVAGAQRAMRAGPATREPGTTWVEVEVDASPSRPAASWTVATPSRASSPNAASRSQLARRRRDLAHECLGVADAGAPEMRRAWLARCSARSE